ncbi:hypothetical protein EJ06DRAFT_534543 [Trichodelitschia bisporula]|uniref:Uncharacterized protein n=1 Tax=Trichodelitschia bisporula TaxID=703511 RepID=A0A6G1HJ37_9PEZI|nr:hypothetical protein EJ06DRAFT_534543 [Trichodelitschia bisporula]
MKRPMHMQMLKAEQLNIPPQNRRFIDVSVTSVSILTAASNSSNVSRRKQTFTFALPFSRIISAVLSVAL